MFLSKQVGLLQNRPGRGEKLLGNEEASEWNFIGLLQNRPGRDERLSENNEIYVCN